MRRKTNLSLLTYLSFWRWCCDIICQMKKEIQGDVLFNKNLIAIAVKLSAKSVLLCMS